MVARILEEYQRRAASDEKTVQGVAAIIYAGMNSSGRKICIQQVEIE